MDLVGVVHNHRDLVLQILEPLLVDNLLRIHVRCRLAHETDPLVNLGQLLLLGARIHGRDAVRDGPNVLGHGEHLVDLRVQLASLVVGRHEAEGLAGGQVVHRTAVDHIVVRVLEVAGLDVSGPKVLLPLLPELDLLGDEDEVGGGRADVGKVHLWHLEGHERREPDVEDRLGPVVTPHDRDVVPVRTLVRVVRQLHKQVLVQVGLIPGVLHLHHELHACPATDRACHILHGDICDRVVLCQDPTLLEGPREPFRAHLEQLLLGPGKLNAVVVTGELHLRAVLHLQEVELLDRDVLPFRQLADGNAIFAELVIVRLLDEEHLVRELHGHPALCRAGALDQLVVHALILDLDLLDRRTSGEPLLAERRFQALPLADHDAALVRSADHLPQAHGS
mmetsp:Transcript_46143/g.142938  ORF Transcript_46143/g.142938 Transcript_46143/m.142938 type:complete len:393 (+) Transcript_46143:766-1944(+)